MFPELSVCAGSDHTPKLLAHSGTGALAVTWGFQGRADLWQRGEVVILKSEPGKNTGVNASSSVGVCEDGPCGA